MLRTARGRKSWNIECRILNSEWSKELCSTATSSFLVRCSTFELFRLRCSLQNARILCFAREPGASLGTARAVTGRLSARGVAHSVKHIRQGERLNQQFQGAVPRRDSCRNCASLFRPTFLRPRGPRTLPTFPISRELFGVGKRRRIRTPSRRPHNSPTR